MIKKISILFLLLLISFSCSKSEDMTETKKSPEKIIIKNVRLSTNRIGGINYIDYGKYHNEVLRIYYEKYREIVLGNDRIQNYTMNHVISEVTNGIKSQYPNEFSGVQDVDLHLIFKDENHINFDFEGFWNKNKQKLYSENKLSPKLGELMDQILQKDMEYTQIVDLLNKFEEDNILSEDENNQLTVMRSVLVSSHDFWTAFYPESQNINLKVKPGSKAIVVDMGCALMFCYSGPLSIIAGGIGSLFANEALEP